MYRAVILAAICACSIASNVAGPAVFNGEEWLSVADSAMQDFAPPSPSIGVANTDIFVGILHYRDPRCGETLYDLFTKAEHPERLNIGLVQQRSSTDVECIAAYCNLHGVSNMNLFSSKCPYVSQITTIASSQYEAKSPSRGKQLVFQLLKDEEFCLTTEVNVEVIKHWDRELINMWKAADNENAILSTYPPISLSSINDVCEYSSKNQNEVPHLCQAGYYSGNSRENPDLSYTEAQVVVENLPPRSAVNLEKPLLTSLYTSSFAFNKCHAERKVPWDPFFENVDRGQDFLKYARLWTKGYDVYTPNKIVLAINNKNIPQLVGDKGDGENHEREHFDPTQWIRNGMGPSYRIKNKAAGINRINLILGYRKSFWNTNNNQYNLIQHTDLLRLTQYGLGRKRSLDAFIQFTGIDTRSHVVFENKCKQLEWVPFSLDVDGNTDESDIWGSAPERVVTAARAPGAAESVHSEQYYNVFHGNNIPLVKAGVKVHLAAALITTVDTLSSTPPVAGAVAELASIPLTGVPVEHNGWIDEVWKRWFSWWVDDWVVLFEHIAMLILPSDSSTLTNGIILMKCVLLLIPLIFCVVGSFAYFVADSNENEEEEGDDVGDVEDAAVSTVHHNSKKKKVTASGTGTGKRIAFQKDKARNH